MFDVDIQSPQWYRRASLPVLRYLSGLQMQPNLAGQICLRLELLWVVVSVANHCKSHQDLEAGPPSSSAPRGHELSESGDEGPVFVVIFAIAVDGTADMLIMT